MHFSARSGGRWHREMAGIPAQDKGVRGMKFSQIKLVAGFALGVAASAASAQGAADPAVRGKLLFLQCGACHAVTAGRKSGAAAGFKYSPAMTKAGLTWNDATLDKWIAAPAKLVPGTTMLFPGVANPADRKAIIAYLKKAK
jgi:cytochrome c